MNISAADISNPAYNIISITSPNLPSLTTWGLIIQRVQLSRTAVVFIHLSDSLPPKKKFASLVADSLESDPWVAFLVPSVPYNALSEFGASYYAFYVFVGPIKLLHLVTASGPTRFIPTTTSLCICPLRLSKKPFPTCSA